MTTKCDFCNEFAGSHATTFHRIYGPKAQRVVAQSDLFVAVPTLGQLFAGSLLVLPRRHHETFASAGPEIREALGTFIAPLIKRAGLIGEPLLFEHGAMSCTGASCGIYHAHIHIVPLPSRVALHRLLPEANHTALTLEEALKSLEPSRQYILAGTPEEVLVARDQDVIGLPSQLMRRRLAETFTLDAVWDWRAYATPEPALLHSLTHYGPDLCS